MDKTSRDIRPCDAPRLAKGKTWDRLTNFIQADFFTEERGFIGHIHPACKLFQPMKLRIKNIEENSRVVNCTDKYTNINYKFTDVIKKELDEI